MICGGPEVQLRLSIEILNLRKTGHIELYVNFRKKHIFWEGWPVQLSLKDTHMTSRIAI